MKAKKSNTTQQSNVRMVNFVDAHGFYQLKEGVSEGAIILHLQSRLAQLSSMLLMTYGVGRERFELFSDVDQDNYLWAASMLADECKELAGHI